MDKNITPPSKPSRVSVPVSAEVLEVFQKLAKAGNMSTGRAIAEWLNDTIEGAEFMASTLERARAAPQLVMRELHAYALGVSDETGDMIRKITKMGQDDRAAGRASAAPHALPGGQTSTTPPVSNTGGKVPKSIGKRRGPP